MRQWFGIVLALLLAIVLVNDVSRLAATSFAMDDISQVAAGAARNVARNAPDDAVAGFTGAATAIASEDATITGYSQEDGTVHVWVEGPVHGMFILGPIVSLWSGGAWDEPMLVAKDISQAY